LGLLVFLSLLAAGCGSSDSENAPTTKSCASLPGTAWIPQVPGVSSSNHDSTVSLINSEVQTTGPVIGLAQGVSGSNEISVSIDMMQDLGPSGSLTLTAQVTNYPSNLSGSAFAYLVSLSDGTSELINLTRSGGNDCAGKGFYVCTNGLCSVNSNCTINWPSAFFDRNHWEQHQGYSTSAENYPSVNVFPTCNWAGGSGQNVTNPSCAFNTNFFPGSYPSGGTQPRLRFGVNYTAKYVLVADSYSTLTGRTAGLKVTIVKKTNPNITPAGAVDLNLILVGTANITASRTAKGQQNLNTLVSAIADYYSQSSSNVKLGTVRGIEWGCEQNGDDFANVNISDLGSLFSKGSLVSSEVNSSTVNVFLVSSIKDDSSGADSNLTILGVDGAIAGPVINGTAVSGMAVSTFDQLDQFNPNCPNDGSICSITQREKDFFQLSETSVHEMGHFFGLNHLSEWDGTEHDFVQDTPICTTTNGKYLTINSCLSETTCNQSCGTYTNTYDPSSGKFCPLAACSFNNPMWWTTKNYYEPTGASDGVIFSAQQGKIIHYHPMVK
jgi:hypothetical protein